MGHLAATPGRRTSITPGNVASLSLIRSPGPAQVGAQRDAEDGREVFVARPPHPDVAAADASR